MVAHAQSRGLCCIEAASLPEPVTANDGRLRPKGFVTMSRTTTQWISAWVLIGVLCSLLPRAALAEPPAPPAPEGRQSPGTLERPVTPSTNTIAFVAGGANAVNDDLYALAAEGRIAGYDTYSSQNIASLWARLNTYSTLLLDEDVIYEWTYPDPGNPAPVPTTAIGRSIYDHRDQLGQWVFNGGGLFVTDQNDISGASEMTWAWLPASLQVWSVDCTHCDAHDPDNFRVINDPGVFSRPNAIDVTQVAAQEAHGWFSGFTGYTPLVRDEATGHILEVYRFYGSGIVVLSHLEYETASDPWDVNYVENETRLLGQQLLVEILQPTGGQFPAGSLLQVVARVSENGTLITDAAVNGAIALNSNEYLHFSLNDLGTNGDQTPGDGVYAAIITLPDATVLPAGLYTLLVSARRVGANGIVSLGNRAMTIEITGAVSGAPLVSLTLVGPGGSTLTYGDTVTLALTALYPDGVDRPTSQAQVTVRKPDLTEVNVSLNNTGPSAWSGAYTVAVGGQYLFDARLTPPPGSGFSAGHTSVSVDVQMARFPLVVTPHGLPATFARGSSIPLRVAVTSRAGAAITHAMVFAQIGAGGPQVALLHQGNGEYRGYYSAWQAGDFSVTLRAEARFFPPGSTTTSLTVSSASASLLNSISQFSTETQQSLTDIEGTGQTIARDGDWFWNQAPADRETRKWDLIVGGLLLGADTVGYFQRAGLAPRFIKTKWSGSLLFERWLDQMDGRILQGWATRVNHAVVDAIRHGPSHWGDWHIGYDVMRRALIYYAAKISAQTADNLTESAAVQIIASQALGHDSFLTDTFLRELQTSTSDSRGLISDTARGLTLNLPSPLPAPDSLYQQDLLLRLAANANLVSVLRQRNLLLFTTYDARHEPWWRQVLRALLEVIVQGGTIALLNAALDGPAWAITLAVGTAALIYHYWENTRHISEDERMFQFALESMIGAEDTAENVRLNAYSGLAQLQFAETPDVPAGNGQLLRDLSRGQCMIPTTLGCLYWTEQEALSVIRLTNTGQTTASFQIKALYAFSSGGRVIGVTNEAFRDMATGEAMDSIELAPQAAKEIGLYFKHETQDLRPDNGAPITYLIFATNEHGLFHAYTIVHNFQPQRETTSDLRRLTVEYHSAVGAAMAERRWALDQADDEIPWPVQSYLGANQHELTQVVYTRVQNPFASPMLATVTQTIPTAITVIDPGGGTFANDQIVWRYVVAPHDVEVLSVRGEVSGAAGSQIALQPAQLSFDLPEYDATVRVTSNALTLTPQAPLYGEAVLPAHVVQETSIPVTVTNMSDVDLTVTARLQISEINGGVVNESHVNVQAQARSSTVAQLPMPPNMPNDAHVVSITLLANGFTAPVFDDIVRLWAQAPVAMVPMNLKVYSAGPAAWAPGAGMSGRTVYDLATAASACSTLFAATDDGVFRSTDRGANWTRVFLPALSTPAAAVPFEDDVAAPTTGLTPAMAVCAANPQVVYTTSWGGGVFHSDNGGGAWQAVNSGLTDRYLYDLAVSPNDCHVAYAATNATGVFKTTNGGASWQPANSGLGNLATRSLVLAPGAQRLYVGTTNGVFRSDNAGGSWIATSSLSGGVVWALSAAPNQADTVYAGLESGGVYKSTNAGVSWQPANTNLGFSKARTLLVDPLDAQMVYAGNDLGRGIYRSSNGGAAWSEFNAGLGNRTVKIIGQDGGACHALHAGTANGAWTYR